MGFVDGKTSFLAHGIGIKHGEFGLKSGVNKGELPSVDWALTTACGASGDLSHGNLLMNSCCDNWKLLVKRKDKMDIAVRLYSRTGISC